MQPWHSHCHLPTFLALACLLGFTGDGASMVASAADEPRIAASASASSVQLAEPFSLKLTVTAAVGTKVRFPELGERLGDFDIIDMQDVFDVPDPLDPAQRTWTRRMRLESIVVGEQAIPSLEVQVVQDDAAQVLRSDPIRIEVLSVLENPSNPLQFRDIQSVVDLPVSPSSSHNWVWWTLGALVGFALAIAALRVWRREKWHSPRDWAMMKLDQLSDSLATRPQEEEATAREISAILRKYLQLQFAISDPGQTPQELLETLKNRNEIDSETAERIETQFTLADQVSFARWPLSEQQRRASIVQARLIVESTSSGGSQECGQATPPSPRRETS